MLIICEYETEGDNSKIQQILSIGQSAPVIVIVKSAELVVG